MQRPIAVVTDSTADLAPAVAQAHHITLVPLTVHFGTTEYLDGVDLTPAEFMDQMAAADKLPTTSQPSVATFEAVFRDLANTHNDILCITGSSRLSGTWQSASLAATAVADLVPVTVLDSLAVSAALGFQVLQAAMLADQGHDSASIQAIIAADTDAYQTAYFVDGLEHLRRSGRIGKATQILGTMLQLRPLLRVEEGQIVPFERTRTRVRALEALIDFARDAGAVEQAAVIYSSDPAEAGELATAIAEATGLEDVAQVQVGSLIASHVGPGMLGVSLKEAPDD